MTFEFQIEKIFLFHKFTHCYNLLYFVASYKFKSCYKMILEHAIKCYKAYRVIPPKNSLPTNLYKELCPKGSQPGLMHGLATIHKLLVNNFQTLDLHFQRLIPLLIVGQSYLFLC